MFSLPLRVVLGCFFIARVHGDFFENHVKKFLNNTVRPCDDFFRHVCPTSGMEPEDYVRTYGENLGHKWLKEMEEEHWKQRPPTKAEKILRVMKSSKRVQNQLTRMVMSTYPGEYFPGLNNYFEILFMAREKMHILSHPEQKNVFSESELIRELFVLAREEIEQSTERFNSEQLDKFRSTLEHLVYLMSGSHSPDPFKATVKAFDQLLETTEDFSELNEHNIEEKFYEVSKIFKKFEYVLRSAFEWNEDGVREALHSRGPWAAGNRGRYLGFTDSVLAVTVNTSIPTLYGYFGHVAGHELFHSYQLEDNFNDTALGKSAHCIASHMNKTCHVYSEGVPCSSGRKTFEEDGSDVEGIQLAYKLFVKRIGSELKKQFRDTAFTNEQMFFYSVSTTHCNPKGELGNVFVAPDGKEYSDSHSAWFVRSNANLSLMKAFHEAFKCKPGDRMYDIAVGTEDCNTFGEPVRK